MICLIIFAVTSHDNSPHNNHILMTQYLENVFILLVQEYYLRYDSLGQGQSSVR